MVLTSRFSMLQRSWDNIGGLGSIVLAGDMLSFLSLVFDAFSDACLISIPCVFLICLLDSALHRAPLPSK